MVVPNEEPKTPAQPRKSREVASRPRPRFGGGAACHQPGRGRNRCAFRHAYGLRPRRPRRQPSPPVRRQHRRSSGDRRVVEAVPHQDGRFGIHRCLLDCSVRAAGSGGLRGLPGGTGATVALRRAPRRTCSTRSGSNACIPTVSCGPRFGRRIPCWRCVPTGGSGRCRCATPPVMPSICRRPWSKSMSN